MTALTVTQVNKYIKALIEEIPQTRNIYVFGEISNFKHYTKSGHMYFTLKDSTSQLKCVMFAFDNSKLRFKPEDGMSVVCFGQVSVYERDGVYQLYVHGMQPKGVGELTVAYEQLKAKLEAQGYFDEAHKKPIPKYPKRIGVATSNMGAAVEDIKNVISRRFPLCEIIIVPTVVQGDEAAPDIVKSITILDDMDVDTIIVGRGGGSIEDLWAFNTEIVANAVYNCKTPIISAVGHETDFTICDFVADKRAATPSAAAELAVPDIISEIQYVQSMSVELERQIGYKLDTEKARLDSIVKKSALSNIKQIFDIQFEKISDLEQDLSKVYRQAVDKKILSFEKTVAMLNALSPLAVLGRGYSILSKTDTVVTNVKDVKLNDIVSIKLQDGSITATVNEVIANE